MTELKFIDKPDTELFLETISDEMALVLRLKTDAQRLRSVNAFWQSARRVLKAAIVTEHPQWDRQQVNREIARRMSNNLVDQAHD